MAFKILNNSLPEDSKLLVSDSQMGFIFFTGKYQSFLEEIPINELVNESQIEVFFKDGVRKYQEHYAKNNLGTPPENSIIFNGFLQIVHQKDGQLTSYLYNKKWCVLRNQKIINAPKKFENDDLVLIYNDEETLKNFNFTTIPNGMVVLKIEDLEIPATEVVAEVVENSKEIEEETSAKVTIKKNDYKQIFRKISFLILFLFAGIGLFYLWKYTPEIHLINEPVVVSESNDSLPQTNKEKSIKPVTDDSIVSVNSLITPSIEQNGGNRLQSQLNDIDKAFTLIDLRIAQGDYQEANKLIKQWSQFIDNNKNILEPNNPEVIKRKSQLKHFSSIIDTSKEEQF